MNAPEDQNGLREALARAEAERDEADRRAGAAERKHEAGLDDRLKADRWKRHRKAERGYDESVSFDRVWAETSAKADRAVAAEARFTTVQATLDAEMEIQAEVRASLRAAEAEITRLKEGMEALGAALKPFAKAGELFQTTSAEDGWDALIYGPAAGPEYNICGDDLRRARSAFATLKPKEHPHG